MKTIHVLFLAFISTYSFAGSNLVPSETIIKSPSAKVPYQCVASFEGNLIEGECVNGAYLARHLDRYLFGNCFDDKYEIIHLGNVITGTCNDTIDGDVPVDKKN